MYINILEYLKAEMSEVVGITKQREGQISNRETVGGVERATLQSSHITEWIFTIHEDVKKRVFECLLETAKIAIKGRSYKFAYITSEGAQMVSEIDGDEFAEADYGLVVDNSNGIQDLNQKLEMLAQAGIQNQMLSFSTVMKLYNSASLVEKQRMVERDEREMQERQQQQMQAQQQAQQEQIQAQAQMKQAELEQQNELNARDNQTKIVVAQINAASRESDDGIQEPEYSQEAKEKLMEDIRQFNEKLALDKEKFQFEKEKSNKELQIKKEQVRRRPTTTK